ncbi:unnamed protein product [Sphagnum jensenii]|uniref:OVATE domain-containing protein n=1 Tax=Sphagnum jensenii TaxID=128206 RepID=A0ABP0WLT2_9BRYO
MMGTTTTAQQQHKKERKPFIWQDHMTEVRELFRRVERVKRRGFSGFSTWADDSPTAETLSKNRLRRRRAQFAVDLTHLNYKEEPFESLTHIHNIRGMCSRIQRQDSVTERKKKDVDLDSRPALLRRPISTATHNNTRRHCKAKSADSLHGSRPYSAPVTDLGPAPLSYCHPKPTVLYDISHKPTTTPFVRGLRSSINSDRPPSNSSCIPLHQCQNFGGGYETPMGVTSHRSLKSLQKSPDSSHSQGTPRSLSISSEPSGRQQDCKAAYQASQHLKKHSSVKWRGAAASDSHLLDSLPLERLKLETGSLQFGKQPSFLTRSQDHQSSRSKEEIILDYNSSHLKSTVAVDSPRETTKADRGVISVPERHFSPVKLENLVKQAAEERPFSSLGGRQQQHREMHAGELGPLKQTVKFSSQSQRPESRKSNHDARPKLEEMLVESAWVERNLQKVLMEPPHMDESGDKEEVTSATISGGHSEGGAELAEDSHVLIKHSSDPYADFRQSMLSMIRDECLQERHVEMEELFQYYLDLNPIVHHEVLKRVITDIRRDILAEKT